MSTETFSFDSSGLETLIQTLKSAGYLTLGPICRDGAIVYDEISGVSDLPQGWGDEQAPGVYRLKERKDQALFGYAVGPQSWKKYLHPPRLRLWRARQLENKLQIEKEETAVPRYALIGARACEIAAIQIQDTVLAEGPYADNTYLARRKALLIVAVQCTAPAATCFCTSQNTGPGVTSGADLILTEVLQEGSPHYLAQAGSPQGAEILEKLAFEKACSEDLKAAEQALVQAEQRISRQLQGEIARQTLQNASHDPHWQTLGERCLSCSNCTMVCPTCFCTSLEDLTTLGGEAERWRQWDSCFNLSFSYMGGGHIRQSPASRYRQWLTHKLVHWQDQFDSSGCVGCGRCISWCPVGIDLTEEVKQFAPPKSENMPERA
ncbi:sulfite reductase subunit A [bacterium (Candidatus Blackallbacteria) CG17_big_fil_post_rev_8_21_14_2_50_48_46]|uniref:Sulfite reductase subunit A n=1 Tax=bacterium (Candidatus Blackallbacteria) CG17_big_fil_post_rev_8_21_14_2_50_48_46 TaxID=2014261 RepID=A0A2M7FYL4_9BACT|nr:MAG: sulfite reductase subunit A [bacterium (Candidatus Blackallbacteria) CG18_big_fil_WC_8_21_14_2_50_49_26]PIW14470.1 MAG: sulfite reductase subunit A [bacterium (Candidatus Blackallbacteria) CG17_big_fil_post_rev_8_21_14_2_50_48_46]PIW47156.1 MAG: sulfite reductase subunit A [bacterium (Candidatus Blackallbacteria) CG13_big_fil_rev_8_21_14_2_50_49_14]